MHRNIKLFAGAAALLALSVANAVNAAPVEAEARHGRLTLAVTMTNDPAANEVKVYDVSTHTLLQTLPTNGAGGAGGNAFGVRQLNGELFAAVNNGSKTVTIFRRAGDKLVFDHTVETTSAPVSIDFGNGHMYVAGATTVDSFLVYGNRVGSRDGSTGLVLASGATPPNGSTAQVGVADDSTVLVTLKTDPVPGTVDVIALKPGGAIALARPKAVSAFDGTLTPFGFAVYPDGSAVISLAHSNQHGLFRDGAFTSIIQAGQNAPCWMVRSGKYVFSVNAASRTISRLVGTGNNVFIDAPVAATIATGAGPSDIDATRDVVGVVDHGGGASHISLYAQNEFGELSPLGPAIDVGTPNANGVAILPPTAPELN